MKIILEIPDGLSVTIEDPEAITAEECVEMFAASMIAAGFASNSVIDAMDIYIENNIEDFYDERMV